MLSLVTIYLMQIVLRARYLPCLWSTVRAAQEYFVIGPDVAQPCSIAFLCVFLLALIVESTTGTEHKRFHQF